MSRPLLSQPAGLSSDTLEHPNPSFPRAEQEDQWSDAHDTVETDDERDAIEEISERQDGLTIRPPKLSTTPDNLKTHEMHTPSPTVSSPPPPQDTPSQEGEAGSVHSLPMVQVTEPTSPVASPRSVSSAYPVSPTSSLAPTTNSSLDRRNQLRAAPDTRASNRISGFFSNLIHRRDHLPHTTRESMTPPPASTPPPVPPPRDSSRTSSPLPSRPATPPPALPAPSLSDLGLSLSSITLPLSPSHFSSPPCSGAFLAPHYLLLCHAQGLDVLPLISPPAPQPYSLIRRVPFKSVVVMEHRGVLVAIAGRRDGVRVYALEEVKRAVEWRVEMEVKRERDKIRREELKKAFTSGHESKEKKPASEKGLARGLPPNTKSRPDRRATVSVGSSSSPKTPPVRRPSTPPPMPTPSGPPPAYTPPSRTRANSSVPVDPSPNRIRTTSVNDVLAGAVGRRSHDHTDKKAQQDSKDLKDDWASSDDEAIDLMAAPSGSQALDERTSAVAGPGSTVASTSGSARLEVPSLSRSFTASRRRPANLDLSLTRANPPNAVATAAPPSPTPTLLSLRHALMASPTSTTAVPTRSTLNTTSSPLPNTVDAEADDEEEVAPSSPTTPTRERISLTEALLESRLPELPPPGSRREQDAILLSSVGTEDDQIASPRTSESFSTQTMRSITDASQRRRRRWSVFDGLFQPGQTAPAVPAVPERIPPTPSDRSLTTSQPEMRQRQPSLLSRSQSSRAIPRIPSSVSVEVSDRPSTAPTEDNSLRVPVVQPTSIPTSPQPPPSASSSAPRFLPRIITNAFHGRRSEDQQGSPRNSEPDGRRSLGGQMAAQAPAPKLEYVKLPGTKGSILVKAVETAKKSFLAILCGENGEKVELFAGTYRTALGLSRTFILPDSPRSLELQLQGDDLVEVFLVFSQNVFGLEPATVRVREVRIGRAERRAARRRLRELQATDTPDPDGTVGEDDTAVNVTIGVAVAPETPTVASSAEADSMTPLASPLPGMTHPADTPTGPTEPAGSVISTTVNTDELLSLAAAQTSPYTTFQQLTFAPNFPLASIADDYIIPPTYPSFLDYRTQFEPEQEGNVVDLTQVQFTPPGLPVPPIVPPSKWYYRDPKGVVHGPWQASLMQQWYKDALLPPDLPVRREEDGDYVLLRDLRLQCVDPTNPFRSSPAPPPSLPPVSAQITHVDPSKPLLPPISVLSQPKHFGPPPLFFSSRGGHSTTIVDARGRSVLKGRFIWSADEDDDNELSYGNIRLGDVKRLEAFDVKDGAVLVAMRQGGLEAVNFADALLLPADHSRTLFPHFHPPNTSVNRRGPFVWRIGTPTSPQSGSPAMPLLPPKLPHRFHGKKQSTGPAKSPGRNDFSTSGDPDSENARDEVFFIGRKDNEVYFCERRYGAFRILCISPLPASL